MIYFIGGVEYDDTPPTVAGDYRWRRSPNADVSILVEVFKVASPDGGLYCTSADRRGGTTQSWGGLWCRLGPVVEIGKAYMEGQKFSAYGPQHFDSSRAKAVMEGRRL